MLLDGFNHIALLTADMDRFCRFYEDVFDAEVERSMEPEDGMTLTFVRVGRAELNVFEIAGNTEATRQTPMFGRGRLDHLGFQAASKEAFDEVRRRLIERGASDGFVTDFGPILSVFFRDPDGLEGEVCVANPDAVPGVFHGPGNPAEGYDSVPGGPAPDHRKAAPGA